MELQRIQTTFPLIDRTLFPSGSMQSFTKGEHGVETIDARAEGVVIAMVPPSKPKERWTIIITPFGWGRVSVEAVEKKGANK